MIKLFRRAWRYMTAALTGKFNEVADPKVQLEQAITEAQDQDRRLKEQAANVIANQKQAEMRLNRAMENLEKTNGSARQALLMADEATKSGDAEKAKKMNQAAESFASRLVAVEKEVESLKTLSLQSAQAADQARAAVEQNSIVMQKKLAERQKLLSQLDQAKMQEQMNKAMTSLSQTVGQDVPTFDEDRGPLRQGAGRGRPAERHRRVEHARDRAGPDGRRGPGPALAAAHRAGAGYRVGADQGSHSRSHLVELERRHAGRRRLTAQLLGGPGGGGH